MALLVLIGGGARSGKSTFALARARALGARRVLLATAQPLDDEMRDRIAQHVAERGPTFRTCEEPHDVAAAIEGMRDADVVVIDCLTLWLSNLLVRGDTDRQIEAAVERLVAAIGSSVFATLVVTNEVGMGVVPESALGRRFRDVAGRAHQTLAAAATEIHFAALGCVMRLRPLPFAVHPPMQ